MECEVCKFKPSNVEIPLVSPIVTRNTALHCTALHCTELHCPALHCTALHCTALNCTALHCTALHCPALHSTALHCTALHWTTAVKRNNKLQLQCSVLHLTELNREWTSVKCWDREIVCPALHFTGGDSRRWTFYGPYGSLCWRFRVCKNLRGPRYLSKKVSPFLTPSKFYNILIEFLYDSLMDLHVRKWLESYWHGSWFSRLWHVSIFVGR